MAASETKTIPTQHLSLTSYVSGFVLSVLLTLGAYFLVESHLSSHGGTFSNPWLIAAISVLAVVQFAIQIMLFLHLGQEQRPRWRALVLVNMIFIVLLLVYGSIWIMYNMNSRMMPTQNQINAYMKDQGGGSF